MLGLDEAGVSKAERFRVAERQLSLVDAFALALAQRLGAVLLTGDAILRRLAAKEDVECHGLLWLFDVFEGEGTLSTASLGTALERVASHPRCRLPKDEVRQRIGRYRQG